MHRIRFAHSSTHVISLALVTSLLVGCASADTTALRRYRGRGLSAPRALVIYDFDATGESIGLDASHSSGEGPLSGEDLASRREVGRVLADVLAEELEDRGILVSRASGSITVPPESMAIGGQIVTADDGSRAKRVFIGFGYGKSRLSSAAQLHGMTESGADIVWEYQNTAASGSKPGILTTLPIGAAVQGLSVMVLVVNGGMSTMGELSSSLTANAKNMAEELADAVEETLGQLN